MLLDSDTGIRTSKNQKKEPDLAGAVKSRKLVERRIKKEKEEEDNAEVEAWWPPFEFN